MLNISANKTNVFTIYLTDLDFFEQDCIICMILYYKECKVMKNYLIF